MKTCVIIHPEWGLFLGHYKGQGYWAKLDTIGLYLAPCSTKAQAKEMLSWICDDEFESYKCEIREINTLYPNYVHIYELLRAGLNEYTGDMKENLLRSVLPRGNA